MIELSKIINTLSFDIKKEIIEDFKKNLIFQNYHNHKYYSNLMTPDSGESPQNYAKRARELGHGILSSCEHGWQGYYYETFELSQENDEDYIKRVELELKNNNKMNHISSNKNIKEKIKEYEGKSNIFKFCSRYNLKFIFSTEAYWVRNRFEADNTNNHIFIGAKNEKGRRAINKVLSEANITGYYYKPRLDLDLILSLPKDDVFITSACVGFWGYDDAEEIVLKLHNHFRKNFMLEVQYHNTDSQKSLNKKILDLHNKKGIDIIMGCDSHYVGEEGRIKRDNILEYKHIKYESEDGWFMDYPDGKTAFERFKKQGVLSNEEIIRAMLNTHVFLTFDDITFNKDIKLPTLYPDKSQEWKDNKLKETIFLEWEKEKSNIDIDKIDEYIDAIRSETKTITDTKMTDYFLIDHEIVKIAPKYGGLLTATGRGSGVSFYVNKLLGFTKVDRIAAPVKMYPDRFMSKERILESVSLPDLDLNTNNQMAFYKATQELLGEEHVYPMIAFGTLKTKSAWKMYAGAKGIPFEVSNEISQQINEYEEALKYADDDEKEDIDLLDYVDEKYHNYISDSKDYLGIIIDKKQAPCGYLIYQGDIKEEIGLIKCKSESTKKEVITAVIDGMIAENYKFLKNDYLKVAVVDLIDKIYKRIGIEQHDINTLNKICQQDLKVWDIYKKGLTLCVNQIEKEKTAKKMQIYMARNIVELCGFIAAIRPGFVSLVNNFLKRKPYSTKVEKLDDLLSDSFSYLLYQESIMKLLEWLDVPIKDTYTIIKKISKKKFTNEQLEELKITLRKNWINNLGNDEHFDETWQTVENFAKYGFNTPHAYCVANDSLYGAYLKSHYPYEFYEVVLNYYSIDKPNKDKVIQLKKEMDIGFNIKEGKYKFGLDNRQFTLDKEKQCIHPSLASIKGFGKQVAEDLYQLGKEKYNSFYEVLVKIKKSKVDDTQLEQLIKLGYFEDYGSILKLLNYLNYFKILNEAKRPKKETLNKKIEDKNVLPIIYGFGRDTGATLMDFKYEDCLLELWNRLKEEDITINEKIKTQFEILGYSNIISPSVPLDFAIVSEIEKNSYGTPFFTLYRLNNGESETLKVNKKFLADKPIDQYDMIKTITIEEKHKKRKIDGKWIKLDETEKILGEYAKVVFG